MRKTNALPHAASEYAAALFTCDKQNYTVTKRYGDFSTEKVVRELCSKIWYRTVNKKCFHGLLHATFSPLFFLLLV